MQDVVHEVIAVGSRSVESANKFIQEHAPGNPNIRAYGTYNEVYADPVSETACSILIIHLLIMILRI